MLGKVSDISGQRFGRLTVVSLLPRNEWKGKNATWLCKCDCGAEYRATGKDMKSGGVKSCGCLHSESARARGLASRHNLIGKKFGRLTVLADAPQRDGVDEREYICQCECGNLTIVRSYLLKSGGTKSCGCLKSNIVKGRMTAPEVHRNIPIDLTGMKFNMLTALYLLPKPEWNGKTPIWRCRCDCGKECNVPSNILVTKKQKSCGCTNKYISNRKKIFFDITGEISPDTDRVIFLDGDAKNLTAENMMSISKSVYDYMMNQHLFSSDPELTKTAVLACDLLHRVREFEKDLE